MSKSFNEVAKETKEKVKVSKSGKLKKTHSKTDFDKLMKAYLNDVDYETEFVTVKDGEPVDNKVKTVENFRDTFIKRVLIDNGVDAQEAEAAAKSYKYAKVDGMYEFISDFLYQYMNAGKKFDFPTRKNFTGSISTDVVPKNKKEYKGIGVNPEPFSVETEEHIVVKSKSKAPKWIKKKFK